MSQHMFRPNTYPGSSMDPVERNVLPMHPAVYGSEDIQGSGARIDPISGYTPGFTRGYSSSIEDPVLMGHRPEHSVRTNPVLHPNPDLTYEGPTTQPRVPDMGYERPVSQPRVPDMGYERPVSQPRVSDMGYERPVSQPRVSDMGYERPVSQPRVSDMGYERPVSQPRVSDMGYERPVSQPRVSDMGYERPVSQPMVNGISAPPLDSNVLFVDGLPTDCTRREVGHIFRPFIGFKDIKVIHKEPRRSGDKATVMCFVEFDDAKCALTAMEALQGYKFDDKKPNTPVLKIHFAHFPFRPPSEHGGQRIGPQ